MTVDQMTALNQRLDTVGFNGKEDWREHTRLIFQWMQQATSEIDRLQYQVEKLTKEGVDTK